VKFVWNAVISDKWIMRGWIGKGGRWFLGFSRAVQVAPPVWPGLPSEADITAARETTTLTVTPGTEGVKWLGCVYGEDDDWRIYAVPIRTESTASGAGVLNEVKS
jgi:hypothetical protein